MVRRDGAAEASGGAALGAAGSQRSSDSGAGVGPGVNQLLRGDGQLQRPPWPGGSAVSGGSVLGTGAASCQGAQDCGGGQAPAHRVGTDPPRPPQGTAAARRVRRRSEPPGLIWPDILEAFADSSGVFEAIAELERRGVTSDMALGLERRWADGSERGSYLHRSMRASDVKECMRACGTAVSEGLAPFRCWLPVVARAAVCCAYSLDQGVEDPSWVRTTLSNFDRDGVLDGLRAQAATRLETFGTVTLRCLGNVVEGRTQPAVRGNLHAVRQVSVDVMHAGKHLVICGPAGSGKSTLIRTVLLPTGRSLGRVFATGSTGIAANAIGGCTLHTLSGIGIRPGVEPFSGMYMSTTATRFYKECREALEVGTPVFVLLDEAFSLNKRGFDAFVRYYNFFVLERMRRSTDRPLDGLILILVGDPQQLQPVADSQGLVSRPDGANCRERIDEERDLQVQNSPVFGQLDAVLVQIVGSMRHESDLPFRRALGRFQEGAMVPEITRLLRDLQPLELLFSEQEAVVLVSSKVQQRSINDERVDNLVYEARGRGQVLQRVTYGSNMLVDSGSGYIRPPGDVPRSRTVFSSTRFEAPLTVVVGARVMSFRNGQRGVVNGTPGEIVDFRVMRIIDAIALRDREGVIGVPQQRDEALLYWPEVLSGAEADLGAPAGGGIQGVRFLFPVVRWDLSGVSGGAAVTAVMFPERIDVPSTVVGTPQHSEERAYAMPFHRAYALTVHSAQGLELNRVIFQVDVSRGRGSVDGSLLYVALTRVRREEDVVIRVVGGVRDANIPLQGRAGPSGPCPALNGVAKTKTKT